ncbi:MAG: GNAT family N-acetyltransferase [Cellvibrionaceae bacterium]|nr:GNAT family N-acetyltransferase [Cellvibrionaceae bacterium]
MIQIDSVKWADAQAALKHIRREVFVVEQQVPEEDEWDDQDATAEHFLAVDTSSGQALGTARFLPSGKVTRMAVLQPHRSQKIGSQLLAAVLRHAARAGFQQVYLDAQISAIGFYEKFGFIREGEVFWDAGIEHVRMTKDEPGIFDDR